MADTTPPNPGHPKADPKDAKDARGTTPEGVQGTTDTASDATKADATKGSSRKAGSGNSARTLTASQVDRARQKFYPDRPEVKAEIEHGASVLVFKDNQGCELSVERFSPGDFPDEGEDEGDQGQG